MADDHTPDNPSTATTPSGSPMPVEPALAAHAAFIQAATQSAVTPLVAGQPDSGNTPLPRALADTIHQGLSQHSADEDPVTVVGIVSLDQKDIETIDREFGGGQAIHTRVEVFDLFSSQVGGASPINGQAQPEASAPAGLGKPAD